MSMVFLECRWLFIDFDFEDLIEDLTEIVRLSRVLECEVWIARGGIFEHGYHLLLATVSAMGEEIAVIFLQTIEKYASTIGYKQVVDAPNWNSLNSAMAEHQISHRSSAGFETFYDARRSTEHNQRVRAGLPTWIEGIWPLQMPNVKALEDAVVIADENNISIHYESLIHQYRTIKFCFKITKYDVFDQSMTILKQRFAFESWDLGGLFSQEAFDARGLHPRLTHETIPTFLETIKPYLK